VTTLTAVRSSMSAMSFHWSSKDFKGACRTSIKGKERKELFQFFLVFDVL
jgi:hypothetical protein